MSRLARVINWMLRPPVHFEDPSRAHGLLVLNQELRTQAVLMPDLRRALPAGHEALPEMNRLHDAFACAESLRPFTMKSGMTFADWLNAHKNPDKHSKESVQFHGYEAHHACTAANGRVVQTKRCGDDPGTFSPLYHKPRGKMGELWDDAVQTFLTPILAALVASRNMLPEDVRPKWLEDIGLHGTGCHYIGLNVTPGKEWGVDQFTWEGTFDPKTGEHHGIHVHHDQNNVIGKMSAIIVLGAFKGFWQFLMPYGLSIGTLPMGCLWADDSEMLHGVGPGSGCRVSIVVANHDWSENGGIKRDGKRRV